MTVLAATFAQASVSARLRSSALRAVSAAFSKLGEIGLRLRRVVAFRKFL